MEMKDEIQVNILLANAQEALENGDKDTAREFYKQAAEFGSEEAKTKLGITTRAPQIKKIERPVPATYSSISALSIIVCVGIVFQVLYALSNPEIIFVMIFSIFISFCFLFALSAINNLANAVNELQNKLEK